MPSRYYPIARTQLSQAGLNPDDEDGLLAAMKGLRDRIAVFWGAIVLRETGTRKSVEILKECLEHSSKDVKSVALAALAGILREDGQDLYLEKLGDARFRDKLVVMQAIRDHCDDRAVQPVAAWLKRTLTRQNKALNHDDAGMTDVTYGLDYLRRFDGPASQAVFTLVRERWDRMGAFVCSWVAQEMPELRNQGTATVLTAEELIASLRKARFFEGFTDEAATLAEARIRDRYQAGISGSGRKYFARFPGFALIFLSVEGEWDREPYEPLVQMYADASFGMFRPASVSDARHDDGSVTLSFVVDGQKYEATAEDQGWLPAELTELIEGAFRKHCGGLEFFETYYPEAGQSSSWTFCRKRAYRAIVKAGLIPGSPDDVRDIDWAENR